VSTPGTPPSTNEHVAPTGVDRETSELSMSIRRTAALLGLATLSLGSLGLVPPGIAELAAGTTLSGADGPAAADAAGEQSGSDAAARSGALPVDPPVAGASVPRGGFELTPTDPVAPNDARSVDGDPSDWLGEAPGYAGAVVHSAGELIYTDHLFDAYGADDGTDTQRREAMRNVEEPLPEAYRLEATITANLPGQVGVPSPPVVGTPAHYGDLDHQHHADLVELRLAADADDLWVLARTSQMASAQDTALLLLLDTDGEESDELEVPFNAGIRTQRANAAVLLADDRGWVADLATGETQALPAGSVATDPSGFTNAIEGAIDLDVLAGVGGGHPVAVTAATGTYEPDTAGFADTGLEANLANVAFRTDEPTREWFDEQQALALHAGSIDAFLQELDLDDLRTGRTEDLRPGAGYHERVFASTTPGLAQESGREGLFQHYGLYLPTAIDEARASGDVLPTQLWLHWRGGTAHAGAALSPGIFRHFGEDRDGIVVSPRGRGTSTWYVGRGHADVLEVLDDVEATQPVDTDRLYVSGHSMGGWGSYLLPILYPDRFAAALPVAGPVTQGAWTGLDGEGCDELTYDDYSPCYIEANGSRPRDQHTRRMLDNLRNTPIGMFYAAADELVPISGALRQHERLLELGYQHRFFTFPAHEHYTHPIVDEWAAGVDYLDRFTLDENPHHVTYIRDRAFEAAVNEVQAGGIDFDWAFDSAFWMSHLEVAEGADAARFDGRTLATGQADPLVAPDTDAPTAPNQTGPYTVTGLQWLDNPLGGDAPEAVNGFALELTGTSRVQVDLERMGIDSAEVVHGEVDSDHDVELRLAGGWDATPTVEVDGAEVTVAHDGGVLAFTVPSTGSSVTVTPRSDDGNDDDTGAGDAPGRSGEAPGRGGDGPPRAGHGGSDAGGAQGSGLAGLGRLGR
jgi:dienelactone hydrolase